MIEQTDRRRPGAPSCRHMHVAARTAREGMEQRGGKTGWVMGANEGGPVSLETHRRCTLSRTDTDRQTSIQRSRRSKREP